MCFRNIVAGKMRMSFFCQRPNRRLLAFVQFVADLCLPESIKDHASEMLGQLEAVLAVAEGRVGPDGKPIMPEFDWVDSLEDFLVDEETMTDEVHKRPTFSMPCPCAF